MGRRSLAWHAGYWGPHVGFYGGVNYGFGYGGVGYLGGRWANGAFSYNRSVNNFGGAHITNVYNQNVVTTNVTRVSFNGGAGGTNARPTPREEAFAQEHHLPPTGPQADHEHAAAGNHALLASVNHGRPAIAATSRPGEFTGHGVVAAGAGHPPGHGPNPHPPGQPGHDPNTHPAAAHPNPHQQPARPHPPENDEHRPKEEHQG